MKKILFITLLILSMGYPALTILAQEAAKEVLEDILIKENDMPQNNAEQNNEVAQNETAQSDAAINAEAEIISEEMVVEQSSNGFVKTIRNPDTEVIMPKKSLVVVDNSVSPMDKPLVQNQSSSNIITATHPQLNLTEDKSEMIRLSEKAASVIVGNPNHISVLLDTPDTLIVVPRRSGASHFTVIGEDGKIIMERHVIVGAPTDKYVRIRRSCNGDDQNCQQTSVYYCPNTCHEVIENAP